MDSSYWQAILGQWAAEAPVWCALFGGIVAACVLWERHPQPALLALLAAILLGFVAATRSFAFIWLTQARATHFWTIKEFGARSLLLSVAFSILQAVSYVLLLTAVFIGRRPAAGPVPPPLPTDPRIL